MAKGYVLSESDVGVLRDLVRRSRGGKTSSRPTPTRRTPRSGGGTRLAWAEVTTAITEATAWGTWGTGEVQDRDDAGATSGDPYEVENRYPDTTFSLGAVVCVDKSFTPPRVVAGSCSAMPSE